MVGDIIFQNYRYLLFGFIYFHYQYIDYIDYILFDLSNAGYQNHAISSCIFFFFKGEKKKSRH